jgi:hypothetical protein
MNARCRLASAGALLLPILLSGCSLLPSTRKLPIPKAPLIEQTVNAEGLVTRLNGRWKALDTLTATVEFQASVIEAKEGVAKHYPTLHGPILWRKATMLRAVGSDLGVRVFDMAWDGKDMTLSIPPLKKVLKGANSSKKKSANALENLRPKFFWDAMAVPGLDPDDLYSVVADSEMGEDAVRKHLYTVPEYILSISRPKPGSQQLTPVRVVIFHRDDLQPYEQDIYNPDGELETQVLYAGYQNFDSGLYPSSITIKRPQEGLQFVLTVEKEKENQALPDDQFVVKVPEGTETQKLE